MRWYANCVSGDWDQVVNNGKAKISISRISLSVWVAILLALIGGLVIAYIAYHVHVAPTETPFDGMR